MKLSIEKIVAAGFALAVLCLSLVGIVSFQSTLRLTHDAEKTRDTQEIITQLGTLLSILVDDETGARGYIITGLDSCLQPHRRARDAYPGIFNALREAILDNPRQQSRLGVLEPVIAERLLVSQKAIDLRRNSGFPAAREFEKNGEGKRLLDSIRIQIAAMIEAERSLLKEREQQTDASVHSTLVDIVLASVVAFLMAAGAAWLMERGFRRRQRMEEELGITYKMAQRQAVELRSIIDCMPDAVYFGTSEGVTISNENARKIVGVRSAAELRLTAAEMARKFEMRSPQTGQPLTATEVPFQRALNGETVIEEIMLTHGESGQTVHVRTACAPLMEEGRVIGAVAVNSDITERKRAELALNQSEERYRHLISLLPVAVYTCDAEGFITLSNQRAIELWGREIVPGVDRWCGSPRIFRPDGAALSVDICPMAIALKEGRSVRGEEILIERNDGSRRWVLPHPDPIFDASGRVVGAINALVDITPLRHAEAALRESAQRLRSHQEHSPIAVIELDADLVVARWTGAAEKIFGWTATQAIGKSLEDLGINFPRDWSELAAAHASDGILSKVSGETLNRTREGGTIHCEWYNTVLLDGQGSVSSIVARALNVTARRRADDALRSLNAELEARVLERTEVLNIALGELRAEMVERQRLEHEILKVSEHEQARLGQDLHDDLGQQLAGMAMLAQLLSNQLGAEAHPKAPHAAQLKAFLTDSISTTRDLAKSLYPVELENGGLLLALSDLAHRTELVSNVRCALRAEDGFTFEKAAAIHLYRIVQESLSNALRHGKPSHIAIDCTMSEGMPKVTVTDDGGGFIQPGSKWTGMGLHLFQYRARAIGAEVMVGAGENGGCKVTCLMKDSQKKDA